MEKRVVADRSWDEYPIGTKAHSVNGGYWIKKTRGWKWCTGSTFPRPGGDAYLVTIPENKTQIPPELPLKKKQGAAVKLTP